MNTTIKHQAPPLTIAYLVKGFFDCLHKISGGHQAFATATENCAEMEAVERLTEYADMVEQIWQERFADTDEWGGVWEYEVTEPFGDAIAEHLTAYNELPDDTRAKQLLASIIENELEN